MHASCQEKSGIYFQGCRTAAKDGGGTVTKHLQIRLEEEEYEEVENTARRLGLSLTSYGKRELLRAVRGDASGPFSALTKHEEQMLAGLLAYLRQRPYSAEKSEIVALFERLANRVVASPGVVSPGVVSPGSTRSSM